MNTIIYISTTVCIIEANPADIGRPSVTRHVMFRASENGKRRQEENKREDNFN